MKITVVGGGNGGQALAGHLALLGNDVVLYEHPTFAKTVEFIKEKGNNITLEGAIYGIGSLRSATNDISKAVRHAEILFFVVPSYAQDTLFDLALPFLKEGQLIIFLPGNFASLVARKKLLETNLKNKPIFLAETDTIPYACRQTEPGHVSIWGIKNQMMISSLPSSDLDTILVILEKILPIKLAPLKNVLTVGFANTNMILHCPTMIMNAGRIEGGEKFRFYTEGITPSICKVMEEMDNERLEVGASYNLSLITAYEDALQLYPTSKKYASLYETLHNNPVYSGHGPDSPTSMTHRYLTEDVPYLLVPVSEFGALANINTPTINSIIHLAGIINDTTYKNTGRTLEAMGLGGMSLQEILQYVH